MKKPPTRDAADGVAVADRSTFIGTIVVQDRQYFAFDPDGQFAWPVCGSTHRSACDAGAEPVVPFRSFMDRAAAVAIAVMQMIATAPVKEQRPAIENYLRDEFANIERQTAADRETGDV
jgi:hypothetical protein